MATSLAPRTKTSFFLGRSLLLLLSASALMSALADEPSGTSLRPKIAFVPHEVTLDGMERPDLGRALADSFSAAAIKRGKLRVFAVDAPIQARPMKGRRHQARQEAPAPTAGSALAKDVDFLYTFNVVGEADRYALTMKKVRANDGEVLEAHHCSQSGRVDRLFAMVPSVLDQIDASMLPPPFPRTQSPASLNAPTPIMFRDGVPMVRRVAPATWQGVPPEFAEMDLTNVPKALTYQRLGVIGMVVNDWRFAIITPTGPTVMKPSDHVDVLWEDGGPGIYSKLKVSGHDSGKVIADFGDNPAYHKLFPGDSVYGWAVPAKKSE